ncbi:class I SAM-dependent methyltransferase [Pseudomonas sp. ABC1]|uniref:class I SAM-dependent methyltransferase n=1 Tax=Pseudomonas sp. ABC1 TaxID=2748080 RepID=UPI0015C40891|nr:class I SAM-dependent methyltransferase [Pseudomonas sp. ABC1]QLF93519.1 class I SAM-dependent methyltransferase [Pseudomonas sp. ABC1]
MTVQQPITPELQGVPETMLMTVWNRSRHSQGGDALLDDPLGEGLVRRLNYDFRGHFGKPHPAHAIRSRYADERVRDFLKRHPSGAVVALGEGLETQFWRVDNGRVDWYSVDLPESIAIRRRLLPESSRNYLVECSALDHAWLERIVSEQSGPVFISAAGLFMYFEEQQVLALLKAIVARLGQGELFFDTIPPWFSRKTLKGWQPTPRYTAPPMPWGIELGELPAFIAQVEGLRLRECLTYAEPWPRYMPILSLLSRIRWLKNRLAPGLVHAVFERHTD